MTDEHRRHLETLAQIAHADHMREDGPITWDRCDHSLCRRSREVLNHE